MFKPLPDCIEDLRSTMKRLKDADEKDADGFDFYDRHWKIFSVKGTTSDLLHNASKDPRVKGDVYTYEISVFLTYGPEIETEIDEKIQNFSLNNKQKELVKLLKLIDIYSKIVCQPCSPKEKIVVVDRDDPSKRIPTTLFEYSFMLMKSYLDRFVMMLDETE
jgi:hypothetical protein